MVISKKTNKSKNSENTNLSGFALPSLSSEELYDFLKNETGIRVPRKDVTRMEMGRFPVVFRIFRLRFTTFNESPVRTVTHRALI